MVVQSEKNIPANNQEKHSNSTSTRNNKPEQLQNEGTVRMIGE